MPFLIFILNLRPESAVLTSLIIQTAGMGSGTIAFLRQKRIDFSLVLLLIAVTVPGIALGAYITHKAAAVHLELVLGLLTLMIAFLFVSADEKYSDLGQTKADLGIARRYSWQVSLMSIASGMLSISIGEWLIPLMRNRMSLRMSTAIATSIATIFGTCVIGTAIHLGLGGQPDLKTVLWAVPGVVVGGQIGPHLTKRIDDRLLKEIFVFLLTLIGIHLIYNAF